MRRVVVTGLGLVTPLACGVEESWAALLAGKSGASRITKFKIDDLATKIACQVPRGDGSGRHLQSRSMGRSQGTTAHG